MNRQKKCRCCGESYTPCASTRIQQKTCAREACRAWRRRQAQQAWRAYNPLYDESRRGKQAAWRAQHPDYWRQWRRHHPAYVRRNREAQKRRDTLKRGCLAKQNELYRVQAEKTMQKARLCGLAKQNAWPRFIDGLWRFSLLAKQNDLALGRVILRE